MSLCIKCGKENEDGAKFCGYCGQLMAINTIYYDNQNIVNPQDKHSVNNGVSNNQRVNSNVGSSQPNINSNVNSITNFQNANITPNSNNNGYISTGYINDGFNSNVNSNMNSNISNNMNNSNINRVNPNVNRVNNATHVHKVKKMKKKKNHKFGHSFDFSKVCFVMAGLFIVAGALIFVQTNSKSKNYYFSEETYVDSSNSATETYNPNVITISSSTSSSKSNYKTAIIYDNTYSGVNIGSAKDAYSLISNDSSNQKVNCPSEILSVENDITNKYGITAVNLCEMDVGFARELENVIDVVYKDFPSARGYITNLSLANAEVDEDYIAAFMPFFPFATGTSEDEFPLVIKTQILLNSTYFLNSQKLKVSVREASRSGHFPPNSTIYSPVAHEFGHLLSFLAMMRSYSVNSVLIIDDYNYDTIYHVVDDFNNGNFSYNMIMESYELYKNKTGKSPSLDKWRGTISDYALAKDNSGNYIWDETIAEAFHDVYLNGSKASDASIYIYSVLKSKFGG